MLRLENIDMLWGLLAIPVFTLLYIGLKMWKNSALRKFGELSILQQLMPNVSKGKPVLKLVLFSIAYAFLIVGLANPQLGTKLEEVKREGVDLMLVLDVSNSMNAEDLSPTRLELAKLSILRLIDQLRSDRIGIIVFGGQAYVQLPITTDYAAAKLFVSTISTNMIPTQGTAIGAAIDLATKSFDPKSPTSKAIVVFTDGENHEDDAAGSAAKAAELKITVHTIGLGVAEGAPIPVYKGKKQIGFRKDKDGTTIITKLNEAMLKEIASAGKGIYVRASNARAGLDDVIKQINKLEKTEFETKIYTDFEDRFQYFLAVSILFLLIEFFISDRKSSWLNEWNIFQMRQ